MAASSPVPNNKVTETAAVVGAVNGNATTPQRLPFTEPPRNLRGLNKPKCIKCGNVARSRCPFQSCKSCCSKADNPCYIHVLKQSTPLPENISPSSTPPVEQQTIEAPPTGPSWRLSLLRQQATTTINSVRARRPLTGKDAVNINKWRFAKLREHTRRNLETESEAFDRYLQNVRLLEETFSVNERLKHDEDPASEGSLSGDKIQGFVSMTNMKLKPNAENTDRFKERLRSLVDDKLRKLREWDPVNQESQFFGEGNTGMEIKRLKVEDCRAKRNAALNDLVDKLNNVQSEEDFKSCLDMKLQLFNQPKNNDIDTSSEPSTADNLLPKQESDGVSAISYSLPAPYSIIPMDQEAFSAMNAELSSLNEIVEL